MLLINNLNPQQRLIDKVVDILNNDGVIAYPTDTVYSLGCSITNKKAIDKLYQIKRIKTDITLSFLCRDIKEASQYAVISNHAFRIIKKVLPGAYIFILDATSIVPRIMHTKQKKVAIRIPDNRICESLLDSLGHPIISTVVRDPETGQILQYPWEIEDCHGHILDEIIDSDDMNDDFPTIIDFSEKDPVIIREGVGDITPFL